MRYWPPLLGLSPAASVSCLYTRRSVWLFIGQSAASTGFVVYRWLLDNWGFLVTNVAMRGVAVLGQVIFVAIEAERLEERRLSPSTQDHNHGLGLVGRLVEQVRGSLVVASAQGTVWTIKFSSACATELVAAAS